MADYNIEMKKRDAANTAWDNLYPITKGENVVASDGVTTFETHLSDYIRQIGYGTTGGSANAYTLTLSPALSAYTAGVGVTVKINVANTGASTININGLGAKAILDSKGNAMTSSKLRLNGVYTLRYDGTNFILQGEGGSGNAIASDLLSGKTASTDAGDITGTIASKSAATIIPSGSVQTIAAGQYLSGIQTISAVAVPVANVLTGTTIAGQAGTMPNRTGDTAAVASSISSTTLKLRASNGYRDGVDDNVTITDANFIADNIANGVSIFGLTGTNMNKKWFIVSNIERSTDMNDYYNTAGSLVSSYFIFINNNPFAIKTILVFDNLNILRAVLSLEQGIEYCASENVLHYTNGSAFKIKTSTTLNYYGFVNYIGYSFNIPVDSSWSPPFTCVCIG